MDVYRFSQCTQQLCWSTNLCTSDYTQTSLPHFLCAPTRGSWIKFSVFLVNLASDTRSLQLFPKTVPHHELAKNPVQELFLYFSCLSSPFDKAETLITLCLKHTLAMPRSHELWFSRFSRGLQVWGRAEVTSLQQHFTCFTEHSEHSLLQQHLDPEHSSEADGHANGKYCWKWKKSLPSKEVSVSTAYHVQNEKALVLLKVPTFSLLRLHLPPTSPRAGPLPLLPKPDKLRSTRGQQKLPGNRDWSWKKAGNACVLQGLRRKTGLPDNVRIWQKGRRLLKLSWNRKNRRFLLSHAFTRRPLKILSSHQENPQPSWNTMWICPAGKSWILSWPIFLIYQIIAHSNFHNQKCY